MKRMTVVGIIAVVAVVGLGVLVAAQPGSMGHHPGPGLWGLANITDAQRADLRKLMDEHRQANGAKIKALGDLRGRLHAEVLADAPNTGKIEELKGQIAAAEAELLSSRIDLQLRLAGILTPEQRAKARERHGGEPGMGNMGPGRRGMRGFGRRPML